MKRRRVVAYVSRVREGTTELLVFEDPKHSQLGVQVPAGRLDPDERLEAGLRWVPIGSEPPLFGRRHPLLERLAEPIDER